MALLLAAAVSLPSDSRAQADGVRTISFFNMHTKERLAVTYKQDGRYNADAMKQINHVLRDWRRDEEIRMDPELIDLIYTLHEQLGSKAPIGIVSGYRSPVTNAKLRRRSRGVAQHSQHMHGKAIDLYFPDVPLKRLREAALVHQEGGVGYYPTSGRPFVHVDTARVRHWPRMPRTQLARLFPDGNTQHVPADGRPLARKISTEEVRIAQRDEAPPKDETIAERNKTSPERSTPPRRPIVVASAEVPSAPVVNTANTAGDSGFSLRNSFPFSSLFWFNSSDDPKKPAARPKDTGVTVAALSPPIPTPRPSVNLAYAAEESALTTASLPPGLPNSKPNKQLPNKQLPNKQLLVLAGIGPTVTVPAAPEPLAGGRDAISIWTGGMSYQPPAVVPLVANWPLRGPAFAIIVAPDQMHLDELTRAPSRSLMISFTFGPAQSPYSEAFIGPAITPLRVADVSAPVRTAAR